MAPILAKSLSRLSRAGLIELCLEWTQSTHATPYLTSNRNLLETEEEDYLHEPVEDRMRLQQLYDQIKHDIAQRAQESMSKRDIIDRIVDGDWRRGLSLHQLATIDFASLEENDASLRWTALKLIPLKTNPDQQSHPAKRRKTAHPPARQLEYPQLEPVCFVRNLKRHISPLVKAHYTMRRLKSSNLTILRLYIVPSQAFAPSKSAIPETPKEAVDSARTIFIALPDSCPYIYISLSGSTPSKPTNDAKSSAHTKIDISATKRIILEAIPKAFSRPQERWSLESTKLTTRSLRSMSLLRGNGRPGTAGGAYAKFSDEYNQMAQKSKDDTEKHTAPNADTVHMRPSQVQCPTPPPEEVSQLEIDVNRRFGTIDSSHAALNRVCVKIENVFSPAPYTTGKGNDQISNAKSTSKTKNGTKRKRLSLEEIERGEYRNRQKSQSQVPEQPASQEPAPITITFSGTDVVAGLRQLALLGNRFVDLDKMPAWVTGEKGVSTLTV